MRYFFEHIHSLESGNNLIAQNNHETPVISVAKEKSWDEAWENVFQNQDWGKYPPEELIRFVARNYYRAPIRRRIRFLDLGCGTGACSWYLAREGFQVYGVDGARTAIEKARQRFAQEGMVGDFKIMDFMKLDFPDSYFDAVIDVCALQCNDIKNAPTIIAEVGRVLNPEGRVFSMLVARGSWAGPYVNQGHVHFYELDEVRQLFSGFHDLAIEVSERSENSMKDRVVHWVVSCKK